MTYGRLLLSGVGATLVYYVLGFLLNGFWLKNEFPPYKALFRTQEDIMRRMPVGMLGTLLAGVVLSALFAKFYGGGVAWFEGARFGALVGALMIGTHVAENFVTMPFGAVFTLKLAIGGMIQWIAVGVAIAAVCVPALVAVEMKMAAVSLSQVLQ